MATPEPNLLDHVKDDTIWKAAGAIIVALAGGLAGLAKLIYNRDRGNIKALFAWKDKVVDPALRDIPRQYVSYRTCQWRHEDILRSNARIIEEATHMRALLEKHLGVNGGSTGP